MGERNEVKVRLSTVVCVFIILVLVVALGVVYYLGFVKNDNANNMIANGEVVQKNNNVEVNVEDRNEELAVKNNIVSNEQVTEEKEETKKESEIPTTDLVAVYCDANNERAELFFSYVKDGKVYYFHENDYEGKTTGQYYKFSINLMGQYQYEEKMKQCEGIDNAKRIKMYNSGTGIKPVIYVITEDGKVYTGSFFEHDFALHLDNRLKEYEVEDILSKTGEMKDEFKLLLKDGTTKTVTVEL